MGRRKTRLELHAGGRDLDESSSGRKAPRALRPSATQHSRGLLRVSDSLSSRGRLHRDQSLGHVRLAKVTFVRHQT